ncbi:MAG: molybdenum cofactor biosynthesis protein MoaE [Phycisphaeraceae bacterium]|nr:MAG: molybdenum cofactor biosynthesis protein MoaE [Phycisphaeraceae bacterium]
MDALHPATPRARVLAAVLDGPLTPDREMAVLDSHGWTPARDTAVDASVPLCGLVGATLRFEGVVRRKEPITTAPATHEEKCAGLADGSAVERDLQALNYQTYDPMAERGLLALSLDVAERHGLIALAALHSRGRVIVGEVSFVLIIESSHRAEAIAAMSEFIDRLKQDVPIWKVPVWR